MDAMTPDEQWYGLARQARALAVSSGEEATARGLREVVEEVYNASKFDRPGGEGLDGADGPERRGIGRVRDAAETYFQEAMNRFRRL